VRMTRVGRVSGSGTWRALRMGSAALIAVAAVGTVLPTVASASPQALDWTRQAPAASPRVRADAAMAYDAATGTTVMFGGYERLATGDLLPLGDTWTWDGTTWTRQAQADHPSPRYGAAMAYDAATGTMVLFGGYELASGALGVLNDTWTWNGTTWTQQHPAVSPPALNRASAAMAYDAATGTVVLSEVDGSTWTWNGTTWTQQTPAASPPARFGAAMAYDTATGTVVLFGGQSSTGHLLADTWTWDGTTWTQQAPATSPHFRYDTTMAYDATTGTVVLFGGTATNREFSDTWTWDGTTWTQQTPATHPFARGGDATAYDATTGTVVLFGGYSLHGKFLKDTWTWA
jgi:hypothetical protein